MPTSIFLYGIIQGISLVSLKTHSSHCTNHVLLLLQGKQSISRLAQIRNRSNLKCLMLAECDPSSAVALFPFGTPNFEGSSDPVMSNWTLPRVSSL